MRLWVLLVVILFASRAWAQPAEPAPTPAPDAAPPVPVADPAVEPPTPTEAPVSGIRVHVLSTGNTYLPMTFDIYSVETKRVVASGAGAVESRGEPAPILELKAGTYKIVRSGEPFNKRVDYAIATVLADTVVDYVLVVDPDSFEFRGSGPLIGDLPKGTEIAGIRLSLNGGGTLLFTQIRNGVGTTSGTTSQFGLFGNFGLVIDRGVHFIDVNADANPITGSMFPSHDRFAASGLYAYHAKSSFLGPYVRAGMVTHVFPGYVYLERNTPGTILITHTDGTVNSRPFGLQANPDDLRIKVASPFAPLKLQEELGANLKAVDLDLLLVKLNVGTRLGFGFRQGLMNGLLVMDGKESDEPLRFREVDNYSTLGPVIGANASVTFARWLFGSAQFGVLAPLTQTDKSRSDNFGGRLLIDFSGSAGFKVPILTNLLFASADYTFRLERDAFITADTQFEHALMARASITLF